METPFTFPPEWYLFIYLHFDVLSNCRRFISEESQRKDLYDRLQLETRSQNTNPLTLPEAVALFLSSLQKAPRLCGLTHSATRVPKYSIIFW
uniref:Spexin hormone n=1 Tax=Podarcis muralis TaxID=64176 RepID=A0A670KLU9_PODMU